MRLFKKSCSGAPAAVCHTVKNAASLAATWRDNRVLWGGDAPGARQLSHETRRTWRDDAPSQPLGSTRARLAPTSLFNALNGGDGARWLANSTTNAVHGGTGPVPDTVGTCPPRHPPTHQTKTGVRSPTAPPNPFSFLLLSFVFGEVLTLFSACRCFASFSSGGPGFAAPGCFFLERKFAPRREHPRDVLAQELVHVVISQRQRQLCAEPVRALDEQPTASRGGGSRGCRCAPGGGLRSFAKAVPTSLQLPAVRALPRRIAQTRADAVAALRFVERREFRREAGQHPVNATWTRMPRGPMVTRPPSSPPGRGSR
jgi:hypothetical protein